jgi:hypothetical protein
VDDLEEVVVHCSVHPGEPKPEERPQRKRRGRPPKEQGKRDYLRVTCWWGPLQANAVPELLAHIKAALRKLGAGLASAEKVRPPDIQAGESRTVVVPLAPLLEEGRRKQKVAQNGEEEVTQAALVQRASPVSELPFQDAAAVTANDTADLPRSPTRGLYIGTAGTGTLKVDMAGGDTVTFAGLTAGTRLPIAVTRVYATGTGVSSIVALY